MIGEIEKRGGKLELDLFPLESEEQFQRVADIINRDLGFDIVEREDGPGFSYCLFDEDNTTMKLYYSSIEGVGIEATDEKAVSMLDRVRNHFNALLSGSGG